jgi:hypothetical protein
METPFDDLAQLAHATAEDVLTYWGVVAQVRYGDIVIVTPIAVASTVTYQLSIQSRGFARYWPSLSQRPRRRDRIKFCLQLLIDRTFVLIHQLQKSTQSTDRQIADLLIESIDTAQAGIHQLGSSYSEDAQFGVSMSTLTQLANIKLQEVRQVSSLAASASTREKYMPLV